MKQSKIEFIEETAKNIDSLTDKINYIDIGKYEGKKYEDGEFKKIKGRLFIVTNRYNLFMVMDKDLNIIDSFDIIGNDAIIELNRRQ